MVGWHHHESEFEKALEDGKGQGILACCSPWILRVRHNRVAEQQQQTEKKIFFNVDTLQYHWPNINYTKVYILRRSRERRKGAKNLLKEIIAENFPN